MLEEMSSIDDIHWEEKSTVDTDVKSLEYGLENENISDHLRQQYDKELDQEVEKITFGQYSRGLSQLNGYNNELNGEDGVDGLDTDRPDSPHHKYSKGGTVQNMIELIESVPDQVGDFLEGTGSCKF